jgi:hypothetical protein
MIHYLDLTEGGLEFFGIPDLNFCYRSINGAADGGFGVIQKSVRPGTRGREKKGDYS